MGLQREANRFPPSSQETPTAEDGKGAPAVWRSWRLYITGCDLLACPEVEACGLVGGLGLHRCVDTGEACAARLVSPPWLVISTAAVLSGVRGQGTLSTWVHVYKRVIT